MRRTIILIITTLMVAGFIRLSYGDADADALAGVNALINDPNLDQKYKDYLQTSLESQSGVTNVSPAAKGSFSKSAKFAGTANTRCGGWCCGVELIKKPEQFTRTVTRMCYHQVPQYYRTRDCFICSWKTRSNLVTKSKACYGRETYYKLVTQTCEPEDYTRCCPNHTPVGECCVETQAVLAMIELIKTLALFGLDPSAAALLFSG